MIVEAPLETARLRLRNLSAADVGDVYASWLRDPEVNRFLEIRFRVPQSPDDIRSFVAEINDSSNSVMFGIFLKSDDRHIGNIKIGPIVRDHARSEIGYLIGDRANWGKGYASEAIAAVTRFAFDSLGLAKVKAGCYENNSGSAKALLKAGFTLEATIPSDSICEGRRVASLIYACNA